MKVERNENALLSNYNFVNKHVSARFIAIVN